ncbi:MAG: tetratricopeptide repeat protein [Ancrocorticia sp.]
MGRDRALISALVKAGIHLLSGNAAGTTIAGTDVLFQALSKKDGDSTQVTRQVEKAIGQWAKSEHLGDVLPAALAIATDAINDGAVLGYEQEQFGFDSEKISAEIIQRASEKHVDWQGELDREHIVAREVIRATITALISNGHEVEAIILRVFERHADEVRNRLNRISGQLADGFNQLGSQIKSAINAVPTQPQRFWSPKRPRVAAHFQARNEMEELTKALGTNGVVSLCALQGMRGVGKSQLAAKYAEQCETDNWMFVGWVTASTRQQAVSELAEIARCLDISNENEKDIERAAKDILTWLIGQEEIDKLLVFDNVENPDDVKDLLPRGTKMQVLVTTTQKVTTLGKPIPVGVFSPSQAVKYLISATGIDDTIGAADIAKELGYLPVALAQAAAMIRLDRLDFASYRQYLDDYPLDENVEREAGSDYPQKADVALRLAYTTAIKQIDEKYPRFEGLAKTILSVVTLLAEEGVPRTWLDCLHEDARTVHRAIGELIRRNVIAESEDRSVISLHRLQSKVIWEDLKEERDLLLATEASLHVLGNVNLDESDNYFAKRETLVRLAGQLTAILTQYESSSLLDNSKLFNIVQRTLYQSNALQQPYPGISLEPYLYNIERVLGPDHPDTLALRHNLAGAYQSAGDLARAISLYEQTLTDRERVLEPDHPATLTSRNNLADAYRSAGDLARAIPLFEQTFTDFVRVLGSHHPDTLTSRHNLAYAYQAAGDLARAIPLSEQTLTDREQVLGSDHPDTLASRNNLAGAYQSAGDLAGAISLYERTLTDRERVLDPDHPDTLASRHNLAYAYQAAGDLARAIPLFEQTFTDFARVLGPDYPATLTSRNNLADAYRLVGDLARAIPLFEQTLTDIERVLGPDHPDTLTSRDNLAGVYQAAGDLARAIPLFEQTLTDFARVLGADHPATLTSRNNLAVTYYSAGRVEEARKLLEQAHKSARQALSAGHPLICQIEEVLAFIREQHGE